MATIIVDNHQFLLEEIFGGGLFDIPYTLPLSCHIDDGLIGAIKAYNLVNVIIKKRACGHRHLIRPPLLPDRDSDRCVLHRDIYIGGALCRYFHLIRSRTADQMKVTCAVATISWPRAACASSLENFL